MKALRVLIVTTFVICPFVVSMTLHEKNEYQNMDYSEHLRLKRQASKAQATTTTTKTTTSITTTKIKSGTPSQTILRDSSNIVFPANNDGLVTTLISSTMGESTKKPPRKSLMVVPDHSMLAKTKELLKKDVIGPPLSQKDELKLPVNRASTSTVTVNPRLLYNPQLFEGDIYGAKMSEVNLDITLRNVVANEFIKWHGGVVPYVISNDYNAEERAILLQAMNEFRSKSCINWIPRDETNKDHDQFVHIMKGEGCHSPIGRQTGAGGQLLSLAGHSDCQGIPLLTDVNKTEEWN